MTKEEIIKEIQECAKKLGRNPGLRELRKLTRISESSIFRLFGGFNKALVAAGLEPVGPGFEVGISKLLLDWAEVTRKLKKLPTTKEYTQGGRYSYAPFISRFSKWAAVKSAFRTFARQERIEEQWADVLKLITVREDELRKNREKGLPRRVSPLIPGRPVYGPPLLMPEMQHEPINEAGVLFAFGVLARRLGFVVKRWQVEFPDCVGVREMAKGQWQDQNVEVEFCSRNFLAHRHDPKNCDVIVCWIHNWPECPKHIEVIELSKVVEELERNRERGKNATWKDEELS